MKLKYMLTILMLLSSLNLSAKDGVPFMHSFGEKRVYFQDWLIVCAKKGEGQCRMVNYVNRNPKEKTGFFPNSRLSLTPAQSNQEAKLDFYDQGAPSEVNDIRIKVDKTAFSFEASDYQTPKENRIMETYVITNQIKLNEIVMDSKPARWLIFYYTGVSGQKSKVKFSLRGFTKAYDFIQKQTVK